MNLTPNPDDIQEVSNQVNTYSSEYGRGSGLQNAMTTKSGSDQFHGMASDYFNYQSMYAKYSLPGSDHRIIHSIATTYPERLVARLFPITSFSSFSG